MQTTSPLLRALPSIYLNQALHTWAERAREEQRVLQGCSCLQRGEHKFLGAIAQVCAVQLKASPRVQA